MTYRWNNEKKFREWISPEQYIPELEAKLDAANESVTLLERQRNEARRAARAWKRMQSEIDELVKVGWEYEIASDKTRIEVLFYRDVDKGEAWSRCAYNIPDAVHAAYLALMGKEIGDD